MEFIILNNKKYNITDIRYSGNNLIKITFADEIPAGFNSNFKVYTAGGALCSTIDGYNTIYKIENNVVYLSNDGSFYVELEPIFVNNIAGHEGPTLEEIKELKKKEISNICQNTIYAGIDVQIGEGIEHFSLTEHDQLNLFGKQVQLASGAEMLEYHADGRPCKYYTAVEMASIIEAAMQHVSYHTTRCNALNMWIAGAETAEEVELIAYDAEIPAVYQNDVFKAYENK